MSEIYALVPRPTSPDTDGVAHDGWFYSDHIVFLVENRLFKVPKQKFVENLEIFRDMFELPPGTAPAEGQADDTPVALEGVKKDEFRALLRAMVHAPSTEERVDLTMEEWVLILKLTTMWQFHGLRYVAISTLRSHLGNGDPVRWLCLARLYDVKEWMLPSLEALARRPKAMQLEDVESLGVETAIKMAEVRESYRACSGAGGYNQYNNHILCARDKYNFSAEIKRLFSEEL
ncbi:uncharacterized protein TRAVEDRAFT_130527 [Trametes versicolor FP-101664 SS1]|uniref:uncharacterized protein n=1 Tax=Trametes versicolor (strain FP-101664) TaxID=717944 RepID=UPI0004624337|nr:uncharacterized protein TRAVEDRAFT_130527 [Trametes versicolor FP-101664 SS1]EIW55230.1 hypothetical protein TRAVEDRAFT_130527 [Trametes versicolor FP-101664 SS1]